MIQITPTQLKQLYWQNLKKPVANYLNFWTIDEDIVVGVDLQISVVYEIVGSVDLNLMSEVELETFFTQIKTALHSLSENTTLQFLVVNTQYAEGVYSEYLKNINVSDEFARFIAEQKIEFFKKIKPY